MSKFLNYTELSEEQIEQYRKGISVGFPKVILESPTSKKFWPKLESYFPDFQMFLLSDKSEIIGFINSIPFHFNKSLDELSDNGWDWMLKKGIRDYEANLKPNYLGGLQIVIRKEYQNLGYSKVILSYAKQVSKELMFKNLVIPIRPTKKFEHPSMSMSDYINLKAQDRIYDPWIRTHLKSGAEIIKVCNNSMNVKGDIRFWENILDKRILSSGEYLANGALSPIQIDLENNFGEYREPNIWIRYR